MNSPSQLNPDEARKLIRVKSWDNPTAGMANGYIQANLAILPKELAFEFLLFCQRNPKSCPIIDVTEPGSPVPMLSAPNADIRTDLPKYRVYKNGELAEELSDITSYWNDDMVAFLIGCSLRSKTLCLKIISLYAILRKIGMSRCIKQILGVWVQAGLKGQW